MGLYDIQNYKIEKPQQMPTTSHWAIIVFKPYTIHHEGDERSRTNPGHGYPAYTESGIHTEYYAFLKEPEWEVAVKLLHEEINSHGYGRKDYTFKAISVNGVAKVSSTVNIDVKI